MQEQYPGSAADPWREFQSERNKHFFAGLASYYNSVRFYIVGEGIFRQLEQDHRVVLENDAWLAVTTRLQVLLVKSPSLSLSLNDQQGALKNLKANVDTARMQVIQKSDLRNVAPELDQLRYSHLWKPLSWLTKVVEASLVTIHAYTFNHWGLAIVIFSILLNLTLFPIHNMVARMQDEVGRNRALLEPKLVEIKMMYDGEEAHNRVIAAHKAIGVSPFYSLKPLLGIVVQAPIWIAVFNALGEMPQLAGQSFLWIDDLAYPDIVAQLPFNIPLLGTTVHPLPLVMFGVTCLSVSALRNERGSKIEYVRQKRNLYGMAVVFLILLYPFPAAMTLYWTLNNLIQFVSQQFVRKSTEARISAD